MDRWIAQAVIQRSITPVTARYVVFHAMDNKSTSERRAEGGGYFYGTLNLQVGPDVVAVLTPTTLSPPQAQILERVGLMTPDVYLHPTVTLHPI